MRKIVQTVYSLILLQPGLHSFFFAEYCCPDHPPPPPAHTLKESRACAGVPLGIFRYSRFSKWPPIATVGK